jgi:hypothetical protein
MINDWGGQDTMAWFTTVSPLRHDVTVLRLRISFTSRRREGEEKDEERIGYCAIVEKAWRNRSCHSGQTVSSANLCEVRGDSKRIIAVSWFVVSPLSSSLFHSFTSIVFPIFRINRIPQCADANLAQNRSLRPSSSTPVSHATTTRIPATPSTSFDSFWKRSLTFRSSRARHLSERFLCLFFVALGVADKGRRRTRNNHAVMSI